MRRFIKKMTPLLLVVLIIFSCSIPAYAATYPTATRLTAQTMNAKRGKTIKFKFRLNSNAYTKYGNIWRSEFDVRVYNSNGTLVASNGQDGVWFTGLVDYTLKWKVPKTLPQGRYRVNYRTYYNVNTASYKWCYRTGYTTNSWCYVNVK